jgi:hypothetical protein
MLCKDKKAVSVMVSYVILIAIAVVIGGLTYAWLKTYVPQENVECPEGVSIYISKISCLENSGEKIVNLTLKNNGRFNLEGYYIRAENSSGEGAILDISDKIISGGTSQEGFILFHGDGLIPEESIDTVFKISNSLTDLYSIEIIPLKVQEVNSKLKTAVCSEAKASETLFDKC